MSTHNKEEFYPPCQCHLCTWLRSSQLERSCIPKPDAFQKQEKKNPCLTSIEQKCPGCGDVHVWNMDPSAKPTPSPEKCFCGGSDSTGHIPTEVHDTHKPKDAVEEKIKECVDAYRILCLPGFENRLRDLVRLVKETK
jgi:hypothetical protein